MSENGLRGKADSHIMIRKGENIKNNDFSLAYFIIPMTSFIDTHCHLDKLDSTPEEAVKQAKQEGVETMITISVDKESFNFVHHAVLQFNKVYGTLGVHPHDASEFNPSLEKNIRN